MNRLCGSELQAIVSAAQSILLGDADIAVGAGRNPCWIVRFRELAGWPGTTKMGAEPTN